MFWKKEKPPETPNIEYQITRLELKPGDIVILKVRSVLRTPAAVQTVQNQVEVLKKILPPGVKAIALDHTTEIIHLKDATNV